MFGKQPNVRVEHDDDQLCTTEYSRIIPLENGEVEYRIQPTESAKFYEVSENKSREVSAFALSRLWCLSSTVARGPKTSPTRRCCRTSRRQPTSACASYAPAPCWATWSPRPRETPPSHAGWDLTHGRHAGRQMFPIWAKHIYNSAAPSLQLSFRWRKHTGMLPPARAFILARGLSSHRGNSSSRGRNDWLGQLQQAAGAQYATSPYSVRIQVPKNN